MRLDPAMHLPRKMLLVCIVACLFLAARASVGWAQESPGSATLELTLDMGTSSLSLGEPA